MLFAEATTRGVFFQKGVFKSFAKFDFKDFFTKCDQIRRKPRIWSYLQKKCLMESFIFCAVSSLFYFLADDKDSELLFLPNGKIK